MWHMVTGQPTCQGRTKAPTCYKYLIFVTDSGEVSCQNCTFSGKIVHFGGTIVLFTFTFCAVKNWAVNLPVEKKITNIKYGPAYSFQSPQKRLNHASTISLMSFSDWVKETNLLLCDDRLCALSYTAQCSSLFNLSQFNLSRCSSLVWIIYPRISQCCLPLCRDMWDLGRAPGKSEKVQPWKYNIQIHGNTTSESMEIQHRNPWKYNIEIHGNTTSKSM